MTINEALSNLLVVSVAIAMHIEGDEKINFVRVGELLMEARKALEKVREVEDEV